MAAPRPTPKQGLLNELKKDLEALKKTGLIPAMEPEEENNILNTLVNSLMKLQQDRPNEFKSMTQNPINKTFMLFAHFRPEFKDMAKSGQLLDTLTTPQNQLSMRMFALFRLALTKCASNVKESPEQEKLLQLLLQSLNQLEKTREQKKDAAPLCDSPIFKMMVDPLVKFFQQYFGQDIRKTGTAQTANLSAANITPDRVNPATMDQGPGESPAEMAVAGDKNKEQAAKRPGGAEPEATSSESSMKPPWMKTGGPRPPGGPSGK